MTFLPPKEVSILDILAEAVKNPAALAEAVYRLQGEQRKAEQSEKEAHLTLEDLRQTQADLSQEAKKLQSDKAQFSKAVSDWAEDRMYQADLLKEGFKKLGEEKVAFDQSLEKQRQRAKKDQDDNKAQAVHNQETSQLLAKKEQDLKALEKKLAETKNALKSLVS